MPESTQLKYRAFLSYAHVDALWAKWLHVHLEAFRIDEDLVGRKTSLGVVPRALRPIFRDRDDFSGGQKLIDATIAELDQSAALIVLCSAISAQRPAVQQEVRLFRSRHPERPVVPVIVDGAFPANFPPALQFEVGRDGAITDRPVTFLGPDLREAGDGKNLGLAKVVAGLTGLDTDVVFRRAERQRHRRRRILTAVTFAIFIVVLSLGGWAELQRHRFATYLELAKSFNAFQVTDVTEGWDDPRLLAQDTLVALREIVSSRSGFGSVKILWFDNRPDLSTAAKQRFLDGMRGVGISIWPQNDISVAREAVRGNFDLVIANYGGPTEKFAYQLLAEIAKKEPAPPLVVYGLEPNPRFAREARCYGAVARATTVDTLFSAVVRALATDTRPRVSDDLRERCIAEEIRPYNTPEWRHWLEDQRAGRSATIPKLNWN
jgi:hypothetical protein